MSTSASTYSKKNYKMNLAPQYPPFTPDRAQKYISVLYYHRCLKYFLPQKNRD